MKILLLLICCLLTVTTIHSKTDSSQLIRRLNDSIFISKNQWDTLSLNSKFENQPINIFVPKGETTPWWKDILPIFTLIFGIALTKGYEIVSESLKVSKSGNDWIAEIEVLRNSITRQIDKIQEMLPDFHVTKPYTFTIKSDILKADITGNKDVILVFIKKRYRLNKKDIVFFYNSITGSVEELISRIKDFRIFHLNSNEQQKILSEECRTNISEFNRHFRIYKERNPEKELVNSIITLHKNYKTDKQKTSDDKQGLDNEFRFLHNNYIKPVMKRLYESMAEDDNTSEMVNAITACNNACIKIEALNRSALSKINSTIKSLEQRQKSLNAALIILEKNEKYSILSLSYWKQKFSPTKVTKLLDI